LPLVKNDWINPGKVRWVFRDFPLDPISVNASQIGRCLPTDKFFGYVEAVYKDQANWAHLSDDDAIKHLAGIAGLDKKQTSDCLKNTAILDLIKDERITGEKTYGINMTPYFFVNGERIAGDPPYAQLQVVLQNVSPKP